MPFLPKRLGQLCQISTRAEPPHFLKFFQQNFFRQTFSKKILQKNKVQKINFTQKKFKKRIYYKFKNQQNKNLIIIFHVQIEKKIPGRELNPGLLRDRQVS